MSAFVWLDEPRKEALKSIIEVLGVGVMAKPLQDMLDEAEKSEEFKIQSLFTIMGA